MPWGSRLAANYYVGYAADKILSSFAGGGARARKAYSAAKSIAVDVAKGGRGIAGELSPGLKRRLIVGGVTGGITGGAYNSYQTGERPDLRSIGKGAVAGAALYGLYGIGRNFKGGPTASMMRQKIGRASSEASTYMKARVNSASSFMHKAASNYREHLQAVAAL